MNDDLAGEITISYDKDELRSIIRALKALGEEAIEEAKKVSGELAEYALDQIRGAASTSAQQRIAQGAKVIKSSKIGEIRIGYASQRFSGGGTTQDLWGGYEFGSNLYPQFRPWSGRYKAGSAGKFIYPTLRRIQPQIVAQWEAAFDRILKEWS